MDTTSFSHGESLSVFLHFQANARKAVFTAPQRHVPPPPSSEATGVELPDTVELSGNTSHQVRIMQHGIQLSANGTYSVNPAELFHLPSNPETLLEIDPEQYKAILLLMGMLEKQDSNASMRFLGSLEHLLEQFHITYHETQETIDVIQANASARMSAQSVPAGPVPSAAQIQSGEVKVHIEQTTQRLTFEWKGELQDPLVLDMAGDGIDLRSVEAGTTFDIQGNGTQVQTAFIQNDDAFLFLDTNGNNIADNGRELFGDQEGHAHGFAKLSQHDLNRDGRIDANDPVFTRLRIFQDTNGDGRNQTEETKTLTEAGISSINTTHTAQQHADGKGNVLAGRGSFTRSNGQRGLLADAFLRFYN